MRDTELKRKKAESLYSAYRQGLERGHIFTSLFDAGRCVAKSPAPCFFISAKRASLLVGLIKSRVSLINLHPSMRRMTWALWRQYCKYLQEHPDTKLSRERIMEIIVDQPAPEYYMTVEAARKILFKKQKEARKKMGW